jgi:XRE family transcriptional regulator, regulator of sulfur utilization
MPTTCQKGDLMDTSLAETLRVLRARQDLTVKDAASKIGITRETLRDLEHGRRNPFYPTLEKIATAYGVTVEELMLPARKEEPTGEPALSGKAEALREARVGQEEDDTREDRREASLGAYRPRYNVPLANPAETVEEVFGLGYAPTVEDVLQALYGPWEKYVNRYVDRWIETIKAGNFTLGDINECWATIEDLTQELSTLNYREQRCLPPQPGPYGFPAARTGRSIYRLNDLIGLLDEAVRSKFGESESEEFRQEHPQHEALREIARRIQTS